MPARPTVDRLRSHGAPALQACWADESENQSLKKLSSASHPAHWHARVLDSARALQRMGRPGTKRRWG